MSPGAAERFGGIGLLVNNAGVPGPHGPLWETSDTDWWRAMEVNLHATARTMHAAAPAMLARGGQGRVINIVSAAGRRTWPGASAYSVSKAAVIKLTENFAREVRGQGITAFAFHPGVLDLGMTADHLARGQVGDPAADRIWTWLRDERDAGRFTAMDRTLHAFVLLADGTADALSGQYLTPDDIIDCTGSAARPQMPGP
ncbi:SDR family NAD(P)-dependent oxidoreductase [Spirillospora sp. NPDC048911]|uniref:SDR family NAD(P)-dependent oxidoreductase n=1 Tax=Spirillospora sp. NPDC048911 TaxID=3364527 RepID=UPI0037133748